MDPFEEFHVRVERTLTEVADYISAAGLAEAVELADHGEPVEAMRTLAWVIVDENVRVPADLIRAIRAHVADLMPEEFMPPNLDAHALPAS